MSSFSLDVVRHAGRHPPIGTARFIISERESFLLRFQTEHSLHLGEASPLTEFAADDLATAHRELLELSAHDLESTCQELRRLVAQNGYLDAAALDDGAEFVGRLTSPSARFAFDTCVLSRVSELSQLSTSQLLSATPLSRNKLPQSAVIDPLDPAALSHARNATNRGVRALKIKTGRDLETELRTIEQLAQTLDGDESLRVDPNGTWGEMELKSLMERVPDERIEWVEDPSEDVDEWASLSGFFTLASDEVLLGQSPSVEFLRRLQARVLVLKPMALGGISPCLRWAEVARAASCRVSLSHLFDGPVAFDACVSLAFVLQSEGTVPGLGAHAGLASWDFAPRSLGERELMHLPRFVPYPGASV